MVIPPLPLLFALILRVLVFVEFPHNEMQEQIHIYSNLAIRKKFEELCIVELRLQQVVQRDLSARSWHRYRPVASFDAENAHFVGRNGQVDLVPLTLTVAGPGNKDAAVGEFLRRVLERAEFGDATGALELAFVIPLLSEWHEEAFLAFLVLQCYHGLLNVVVVGFKLLFQVCGLIIETSKGEANSLELTLTLDAAAVLGPDIYCNFVKEILIVVMASKAAKLFKAENVFEGDAFELGIGHRGDIDEGVGFRVSAPFSAAC